MFKTSQTYDELSEVYGGIKKLMQVQLINNFVDHLYSCYERQNRDETKSFLVWLGEQGSYSHVVGGRDAIMSMYDVLDKVREVFEERDFRSDLQAELNHRFGEDNPAKLLVHLEEIDEGWNDLHELLTFKYDAIYAWGD
ncbi:MAG: hypothetical protein JWN12_271 [Candidatus Saccharibacteria bacterium]|nr:hypothetical protein [Candidatus Saccharibacteria bacterium]